MLKADPVNVESANPPGADSRIDPEILLATRNLISTWQLQAVLDGALYKVPVRPSRKSTIDVGKLMFGAFIALSLTLAVAGYFHMRGFCALPKKYFTIDAATGASIGMPGLAPGPDGYVPLKDANCASGVRWRPQ